MQTKKDYIELYKKYITRDGADKLLEWLLTTDFFTAPASTRFHSNYEGGLCEHSVKVFRRLLDLVEFEKKRGGGLTSVTEESVAVIALLHDICKVNTYKTDFRNVKKDGEWVKEPYYTVEDALPYGHGEKSVYMISAYMKLSREEAMAINWHMGPYDARNQGTNYSLSSAFQKFPLSLITFLADIGSTYLDEEIR